MQHHNIGFNKGFVLVSVLLFLFMLSLFIMSAYEFSMMNWKIISAQTKRLNLSIEAQQLLYCMKTHLPDTHPQCGSGKGVKIIEQENWPCITKLFVPTIARHFLLIAKVSTQDHYQYGIMSDYIYIPKDSYRCQLPKNIVPGQLTWQEIEFT